MHGVAKVKRSQEENEARNVEVQKKLKLYIAATSKIFRKRAAGELDEEAQSLTAEVLQKNPDFNTLWNYRREILLHFQTLRTTDEMEVIFNQELAFTETCLKISPKTYGTWQHRIWIMSSLSSPNWEREFKLTTLFLQKDERNFHCWDYRRFVAARAAVPPADELEFTSNKISENFSNYSAWHYRSKLLPQCHYDPTDPAGISAEAFRTESTLVQNAVFTDPSDQSAWFYHRWLLGRVEEKLAFVCLYVNRNEQLLSVTFTHQVSADALVLTVNGQEAQVRWLSPDRCSHSYVWAATYGLSIGDNILVELRRCNSLRMMLQVDSSTESWKTERSPHVPLVSGLYKLSTTSLKEDLNNSMELHQLEPENKWVLLTIILLMKAIDFSHYREIILEKLEELVGVDPYRQRYYKDLRSQILVDEAAMQQEEQNVANLRGLKLTCLIRMERFFTLHVLDVSGNSIESLVGVNYIPSLRKVIASQNRITTCNGLAHMKCLEELHLDNNNVHDADSLECLKTCLKLSVVQLQGNGIATPVVSDIKLLLPHVVSILI